MNVMAFKLVTGEDIMAEVKEATETEYVLVNPVMIALVPRNNEQPRFGFMPYPVYVQGKFTLVISKTRVMFTIDSGIDEFVEQYNGVFGSGIVMPSNNIVI